MSYLDWHVGMKVVCIKDGGWATGFFKEKAPQKGRIYTIRTLEADDLGVWLRLEEIRNESHHYYDCVTPCECYFNCRHFRPVQTRKTDISAFTAMLTGTKTKVTA